MPSPTKKPPATSPAVELLAALADIPGKVGAARGIALNNALTQSLPPDLRADPVRATKLREFVLAMVAPVLELADGVDGEGEVVPIVMTHGEIVSALLAGALYVHADRVIGRGVV